MKEQAEKRIDALLESGILDSFDDPNTPLFKYTVDIAIQIPQL